MLYAAYTCHDNASVFTGKKKIRSVHCFDSLIVTAGEIVCQQYIFGVVVVNVKQALIFTLFCSLGFYLLRYLGVDFLVLAACREIYLANIDGITPCGTVRGTRYCRHGVGIISDFTV